MKQVDDTHETVVVKIGGARAVDPAGALADVAHLTANGTQVVVVHGGSTAVDETLVALGEEPTYVETPNGVKGRFTDEKTLEVFEMVMPGKLNTDLTLALRNEGVDAVGLSGIDGGLLTGPRKSAVRVIEDGKKKIKRGDHSGTIESVNAELLELLLASGYTPVVTVPMLASDGTAALGAALVVLTDVPGILDDPDDEETLIETVDSPAAWKQVQDAAEGFMTKKVMAAREAIDAGATSVVVGDANLRDPITSALGGHGTTITPDALAEVEA